MLDSGRLTRSIVVSKSKEETKSREKQHTAQREVFRFVLGPAAGWMINCALKSIREDYVNSELKK